MGEVYRARDERLGRDMAVKVLPQAVTGDPDRLARFQREAKALASITHANSGAIHGVEEREGHQYLTLELVEDRISRRSSRRARAFQRKKALVKIPERATAPRLRK